MYGNEYEDFIGHSNPKIQKLGETKYRASGTIYNAWKMVAEGTFAYLNSKISSEYTIKTSFTDRYAFVCTLYAL